MEPMGGGGVFPKPPTSPFLFPTLTFALSRAVKHAVSLTLSFICMSCAMRKRATHSCSHSAAHAAGLYNSYNCFYNIFGARHSNLSSSERFIELRPQFLVLVSPFGLIFFFCFFCSLVSRITFVLFTHDARCRRCRAALSIKLQVTISICK